MRPESRERERPERERGQRERETERERADTALLSQALCAARSWMLEDTMLTLGRAMLGNLGRQNWPCQDSQMVGRIGRFGFLGGHLGRFFGPVACCRVAAVTLQQVFVLPWLSVGWFVFCDCCYCEPVR